jgi:hypothetical protein
VPERRIEAIPVQVVVDSVGLETATGSREKDDTNNSSIRV